MNNNLKVNLYILKSQSTHRKVNSLEETRTIAQNFEDD